MCSALNGKKEYLKAEVGDEEKWDFLNFAEAWTPSDTMKGDTEDDKDGIFFSHVRKDFILYKVIFFFIEEEDFVYPYWFCISLFFEISKTNVQWGCTEMKILCWSQTKWNTGPNAEYRPRFFPHVFFNKQLLCIN